jgi:hypothetical protein
MFYKDNNILLNGPSSVTLSNGTLVTGPITDINILADAGYLTVRNDEPTQPENTMEDLSQRVVNVDGNYVDITRVWVVIPVSVPETISARQIRLWLIGNNISLASVEAVINSIEDVQLRERTLVEWEYAPYIERNHPLLEALASSLGLTNEQIDQGFIDGSQL